MTTNDQGLDSVLLGRNLAPAARRLLAEAEAKQDPSLEGYIAVVRSSLSIYAERIKDRDRPIGSESP